METKTNKTALSHKKSTSTSLPAMNTIAAKPSISMALLRLQVASLIALARKNKDVFNERGWPPQLTDRLQAALDDFDREEIELGEARNAMIAATKKSYATRDAAKTLRKQVIAALRLALQGDAAAIAQLVALNRTGISPMAMTTWFSAVQPLMKGVQAELKKHFPVDPIELVAAEEERMTTALTEQMTLRRTGTSISAARDATRNALVTGVDQLKLIASIAFADDPQALRGFNKGLGRRRSKAASTNTETQTQKPAPSPAPATEAPAAVKPEAAAKS